jgi:uncharacterized protein (TIGR02246 family)
MNSPCKSPPKGDLPSRGHFPTVQCCALGLLLLSASNTRSAPETSAKNIGQPAAEIRAVLQAQQEAWNRGDLDAFMNGYARSASTVFLSDDTLSRGWQSARERFKIKYRSRAKMGKLRFSDLEIESLSDDAAIVLGRWMLKRANGNVQGHFTLIFRRTPDGWRIVHDHTSTAPAE